MPIEPRKNIQGPRSLGGYTQEPGGMDTHRSLGGYTQERYVHQARGSTRSSPEDGVKEPGIYANLAMGVKVSAFKAAPPTRAPSILGLPIN